MVLADADMAPMLIILMRVEELFMLLTFTIMLILMAINYLALKIG